MRRFLIILTGSFFLWAIPISVPSLKRNLYLNLENEDKAFLNWGYFLGLNSFDFKFAYKNDLPDILVDTSIGFNVGFDRRNANQ